MSECLFCHIAKKELPANFVYDDSQVFAIRDVKPEAPTHVLVMPHRHIESAADITSADHELWGRILKAAQTVAQKEGIDKEGYRLVVNVGENGGQSVSHLHMHLLGGRPMQWPPG
jgi:histidine triad (HIT) family protein